MNSKLVFSIFFSIFFSNVFSQSPELVVDFNQGSESSFSNWNYQGAYINDAIVLPLIGNDFGEELGIIKDGNLSLVRDINPGIEGSEPSDFVTYNDVLYFTANHVDYGYAIWTTDGTEEGTVLFFDPGDSSFARPRSYFIADNGWMYYNYDGIIFRTDGTLNEEIFDGAYFGYSSSYAINNYCRYKEGFAFLSGNNDKSFSIYSVQGITVEEIGRSDIKGFDLDGFGLMPLETGLMYSSYHFTEEGVDIFSEDTGEVSSYLIGGDAIAARRGFDLSDKLNVGWFGGKGYYSLNGEIGKEELLFSTSNTSTVQGEKLLNSVYNDKAIFIVSEGFFGDKFLLYTDGTSSNTENLLELEPYQSDIINFENFAFFADGISNGFDPNLYQFDHDAGTLTQIYSFPQSSVNINSIRPIGVNQNYLYFISNLNSSIGEELYRIKVEVGTTNTYDLEGQARRETQYQLGQIEGGLILKSDSNTKLKYHIISVSGNKIMGGNVTSNKYIDVDLIAGIYFLNVVDVYGISSSYKFIIR